MVWRRGRASEIWITNVQGHPDAGAPTRTQCFTYDALNRLSRAWTATDSCAAAPSGATVGGPSAYWSSWEFEPTGLRTRQVQHALPGATGGDTTTSYAYPAPGPAAVRPHAVASTATTGPAGSSGTSYGYDPSGNTTSRALPTGDQALTWTEHNRLASVTTPAGTTSYVYDADGNQLIRRDPGKTTLYLPTEEIVRDTATGTLTGTRYYTHNGTTVALRVAGANISYLQSDQHATTQVSVKAEAIDNHTVTRREFDPYGNPIGAVQGGPWPDAHGFLNKPHNPATGLTDVGARTYDPTLGRFLSVDPILDLGSPQQWAGYTYANNNPTTLSDPDGLKPICGNGGDECGYEGDAWASSPAKAHNVARTRKVKALQAELSRPVRNKDGKTVPVRAIDGLRNNMGYRGSNDFTYADALAFAAQGDAQWEVVCQWMGATDECRHRPDTAVFHLLLDIAGMVPGLGEPADLLNALWYAHEGSGFDAAISVVSMVAVIGDMAKSLRYVDDVTGLVKGACSFTGDTLVLMADGTHKPIKDIQVGDQVQAADPETGEHGPRRVTAVWVHQDTVIDLITEGGGKVTTTEDHPYWNATDKAWQRADQLNPGDLLQSASGRPVRVAGLRPGSAHTATAYNLTVQDIHTYHVMLGGSSVLVHNKCPEFVPGQIYRDTVVLSNGEELNVFATIEAEGSTLIARNVSVYPRFNRTDRGSLGPSGGGEMLGLIRNVYGEQAKSQGYTHLRIIGRRVTGPVGHI